ncbi:MAG: hypothetical protein HN390_00335 [Anaerolineae bacterium]|nr:hypothetical protein [Anaerolineae bacterium]MBT7189980.1 hypothetical protein [Anaerolineae bacterium]MBT7990678.1 hypothetical protein [Anaerolineae bacterium]
MHERKTFFYLTFIALLFLLSLALGKLYYYMDATLDDKLIVAAIAGIVIVLLGLFFAGMLLSWGLIWIAKRNNFFFNRLSRAFPWIFSLVSLTAREHLEKAVVTSAEAQSVPVDEEILAAIRRPKRRGRHRRYPDKIIRNVVLAWENRGPSFPYTLVEFLEERFGSTPTGMPNVPPATFYDWRKEILAKAVDRNDGSTE